MDAYSSLLNLNFMASMRTGNILMDMLIAMLIPFLSRVITNFLSTTWPSIIGWLLKVLVWRRAETQLSLDNNMQNGKSLEMNENSILHEALMQYMGVMMVPVYNRGNYRYSRLPVKTAGNLTLKDTLEKVYRVTTIPSSVKEVELLPGIAFCTREDTVVENNENHHGKSLGDKKLEPKTRQKVLVFVGKQSGFAVEDKVMAFTETCFDWYKKEVRNGVDADRYLYQPLVRSVGFGSNCDTGGDSETTMECKRYKLSCEKTFRSLFFPEKERLISVIDEFQVKKGKFAIPGFPHRLVLLLYGPPGTGKTSLVKALAAYTGRHIFSIPLSRVKTNRELKSFMYDTRFQVVQDEDEDGNFRRNAPITLRSDKVVYMLEDVDAATDIVLAKVPCPNVQSSDMVSQLEPADAPDGVVSEVQVERHNADTREYSACETVATTTADVGLLSESESWGEGPLPVKQVRINRKNVLTPVYQPDSLSIKGVLDCLLGILDAPGQIVIMTTNHIERLHPDLVRPGIITMRLHMGNFHPECAIQMVKHYFSLNADKDEALLKRVQECLQGTVSTRTCAYSPAEMEQMCVENDTVEDLLLALKKGSRRDVF